MEEKVVMDKSTYEEILSALRQKTGSSEPLLAGDIPNAIASISVGEELLVKAKSNLLTEYELTASTLKSTTNLFYNCTNLKKVIMNPTYKNVASYCFYNTGLTLLNSTTDKEIIVREGATSIGSYAFAGADTSSAILTGCHVSLPSTLTSIGTYAFQNSKFKTIDFSLCTGLTALNTSVFNNASLVTSFDLRNTAITSIGGSAIRGCTNLTKVYLPSTVTTIANYGLAYSCSKCTLVDFGNTRTTVPTLSGTGNFSASACKIVVPDSLYDTWITKTNWSNATIKAKIVKYSDYYTS